MEDNRLDDMLKAPNGRPSRLPRELWAFVRTDAFKAWFGDWENDREHSSKVLDENGEPLLVWHGSNRRFDAFDLSHGGENTGGGEWTDARTGEKVRDDSTAGVFFSSLKAQAASYAMLAQFNVMNGQYRQVQALIPIFNGPANYDFRSREECVEAMRLAAPSVPGLDAVLAAVLAEPGRKIVSDIVPSMPEAERASVVAGLIRLRETYGKNLSAMRHGGLSNQYNNNIRQIAEIESLKGDMDRLRRNDLSVRTEFGTFNDHSVIVFGVGNDTLNLFPEDGRIWFAGEGRRFPLDRASDADIDWMVGVMDSYVAAGVRAFNKEVDELGYGAEANLYGCFLNVRSPLEHDYEGSPFPDRYKDTNHPTGYVAARQVRKAAAEGRDGVIYENIRDPFLADSYGVLRAEDIMMVTRERSLEIDLDAILAGRGEQPSAGAEYIPAVRGGRHPEPVALTACDMDFPRGVTMEEVMAQIAETGRYEGFVYMKGANGGNGRGTPCLVAADPDHDGGLLAVPAGEIFPSLGKEAVIGGDRYVFTMKELMELSYGNHVDKKPSSGQDGSYRSLVYDVRKGGVVVGAPYEETKKTALMEAEGRRRDMNAGCHITKTNKV